MNKIRQFSFQDYASSRQNEGNFDSITSQLSSHDPKNQSQEKYDLTSALYPSDNSHHNKENYLNMQSGVGSSYIPPHNAFTIHGEKESHSQNTDRGDQFETLDHLNNDVSYKTGLSENNNFQNTQKNIELSVENKSFLAESWKKMDKINKMLEEHRKKKTSKHSRSPLGKLDGNIPKDPSETSSEAFDENFSGKKSSLKTTPYSMSYNYNDEESSEQKFSAALHEPFSPGPIIKLKSLENPRITEHDGEETPALGDERNKRTNEIDSRKRAKNFAEYTKPIDSDFNEIRNTREKPLPIEERLRLKELERSMRLKQMRDEKAKKDMEHLRPKPKISENSQKLLQGSRRAKENAEVLEKLITADQRRAKLTVNSKDNIQQSKSTGKEQRSKDYERYDQNEIKNVPQVNLYKKNGKQPSVTLTSSPASNFDVYKNTAYNIDQRQGIDVVEGFENDYVDRNLERDVSNKSLKQSSSERSLQREVADRLRQAIAKKNVSQDASNTNYYQRVEQSPGEQNFMKTPNRNFEVVNHGKKEEPQTSYRPGLGLESEPHTTPTLQTEEELVGTIRSPKHIYLKVATKTIEDPTIQLTQTNNTNPTSVTIPTKRIHTLDSGRVRAEPRYTENNLETAGEEYDEVQVLDYVPEGMKTQESHSESKKRATRQPTFGVVYTNTNTNTITNMSSKQSSYGAANEFFYGTSDNKKEILYENNNRDNFNLTTASQNLIKASQESLINSLRLRQERFSKSGEVDHQTGKSVLSLCLNDDNRFIDQQHAFDGRAWTDVNVYMRNSVWLSVKNNKVAALSSTKEQMELQECTFQPNAWRKEQNLDMLSPKDDIKDLEEISSERNKGKSIDLNRSKKPSVSYKDLHRRRSKPQSQQHTSVPQGSHQCKQSTGALDIGIEPKISVELKEEGDGQKFYLL